jgi:trimethylamine--corrinoid protein Co-methyltransferase
MKTAPKTVYPARAQPGTQRRDRRRRNLVLAPVYGPPFVRDIEGGRRYATMEDFRNFVKLGYMSRWLHHSGGTVCEPTDVPVNKRHLDMLYGAHDAVGQTLHGLGHGEPRTRRGFGRDVEDPVRRTSSTEHGDDQPDQHQLADDLRRIMMGALEVYAQAEPGCHRLALHRLAARWRR